MRCVDEEGSTLTVLARATVGGAGSNQLLSTAAGVPGEASRGLVAARLVGLGIAHRACAWCSSRVTKLGASRACALRFARQAMVGLILVETEVASLVYGGACVSNDSESSHSSYLLDRSSLSFDCTRMLPLVDTPRRPYS
jgi:hypothetical protein